MTERQQLSNLDPDQRDLAEAQQAFRRAFVALVREPTSDMAAGALEATLDVLLHKLSNMIYGSTLRTIDYATATRNVKVEQHGATLDDHEQRLRMQADKVRSMADRQERHATWLTRHDTALVDLTQRVTHIEQALELYEQADACRIKIDPQP